MQFLGNVQEENGPLLIHESAHPKHQEIAIS